MAPAQSRSKGPIAPSYSTSPRWIIILSKAVAALIVVFCASVGSAASNSDDAYFRIPSTISLSGSQSSSDTKSGAVSARLIFAKNFWTEFTADRSTDATEGFETKTLGLSATVGTNPLADYSVDLGVDSFGVDNQYSVREGRIRVTAMPFSVFALENPGIELAGEYRRGQFEFANTPNPVFSSNPVSLTTDTYRFELGLFMLAPWTIRLHAERAHLADGFSDLNRPLAPLFIPETAISTAVSWPGEENGVALSYGGRKWSARIGAVRKTAAVTNDKTITGSLAFDYRWTKKISTGLRYAHSKSEDDSTLEPIQTVGFDVVLSL